MPSEWSDKEIIEELCDIESGLTEWEVGFVESITGQVDRGRHLSPKQREIAEKILVRLGRVEGDIEEDEDDE